MNASNRNGGCNPCTDQTDDMRAAAVGGTCGFLSSFVTLKGWSLMGDAISHAVLPGIVLAYIAGWPLAAGAFLSGLACSAATAASDAMRARTGTGGLG